MKIQRITRLTCGRCMVLRRVKIRLANGGESPSDCVECGPTTWLALPKLAKQEITVTPWLDTANPLDVFMQRIIDQNYDR